MSQFIKKQMNTLYKTIRKESNLSQKNSRNSISKTKSKYFQKISLKRLSIQNSLKEEKVVTIQVHK